VSEHSSQGDWDDGTVNHAASAEWNVGIRKSPSDSSLRRTQKFFVWADYGSAPWSCVFEVEAETSGQAMQEFAREHMLTHGTRVFAIPVRDVATATVQVLAS
jgi:hypothetical protein